MWAHADPELLEMRASCSISHRVYEFLFDPYNDNHAVISVSSSGPMCIVDVMAERTDVEIRLIDMGTSRIRAELTGPWLARRDLALAQLLSTVVDMAHEKRTQNLVDVLREAMERAPGALTHPLMFPPNSHVGVGIANMRNARDQTPANDAPLRVWVKCEHWFSL